MTPAKKGKTSEEPLTKAERAALDLAKFWDGHGAGIRSTRSGSYTAMLRRMEKKGLLAYAGEGPDADGEEDGEFQIWTLTSAGWNALGVTR
jgi:DNA-binding PadR family transcriptional regulator